MMNESPCDRDVIIVAAGASAGGLEALRPFVAGFPVDANMCCIIAQHLSPQHRSMMVQLLSRETSLKVREAANDLPVEAGTVYITPPDNDVTVESGRFWLHKPRMEIGPKPSIDRLFNSVATSQGENAVGVLLSGSGSDGAHGMRAIKAAGGITIAQDPSTAKYDSMPSSAIRAGVADLILPPEEIGRQLNLIFSAAGVRGQIRDAENAPASLNRLIETIRRQNRLDFSKYKEATLLRQVNRRMTALRLETLDQYLKHTEGNPAEIDQLCSNFLISVTSFFRDREAYAALKPVIGRVVETKKPGSPIRFWVPACATGEEPYSLGILLAEVLGERIADTPVKIFATDIDQDAMESARRGYYPIESVGELDRRLLDRYFSPKGRHYQIQKRIRDMVVFARQDLVQEPPFVRIDLISCRNLLIYFKPPLQEWVLENFHYALSPNGYLFLGKSETVGSRATLFETLDNRHKIYQRKTLSSPPPQRTFRNIAAPPDRLNPARVDRDPAAAIIRDRLLTAYAPPSILLDMDFCCLHFHGGVDDFITIPSGRADLNLLHIARPELRTELRYMLNRLKREKGEAFSPPLELKNRDGGLVRAAARLIELEGAPPACVLVSFETLPGWTAGRQSGDGGAETSGEARVAGLERELSGTREHLQAVIEELETSNEELQSLNEEFQASTEELQSANEELQTSNEELQATNEELSTVNEELEVKSAELSAANADLENIQNSINLALVLVDENLRVTRFTPQAVRIFGILPDDVGHSITSLPTHIDLPDFRRRIRKTISERAPCTFETGNENNHFLCQIYPYVSMEGGAAGAIVTFTDISDLHKAQEAQRETQRRFKLITESLKEMVWMCAPGLERMLYVSPNCEDVWGVPAERLMQSPKDLLESVHPDDRARMRRRLCGAAEETWNSDCRVAMPDGQVRWIRCNGAAVRNERGEAEAVVCGAIDISDLKKAQAGIARNESRLRSVLNVSPSGIAIANGAGVYREVNPAFCEMTGYAADELGRMHFSDLVHSDDLKPFKSMFGELSAGKRSNFAIEHRFVRKNGEVFWVRSSVGRHNGGRCDEVFTVAVVNDITEAKSAEEALRINSQRLTLAMEASRLGVFQYSIHSPGGTYLSPRLIEMLGHTAKDVPSSAELPGWLAGLVHPDDRERLELDAVPFLDGRLPKLATELRLRHKTGGWITAHALVCASARGGDGRVECALGVLEDITSKKASQNALEESESLFRSVFNHSSAGIGVLGLEGGIRKANPALCALFGHSEREMTGMPLKSLLHPDDREMDWPGYVEVIRGTAESATLERRFLRKGGRAFWGRVTLGSHGGEPGGGGFAVMIVNDITESRQREALIERQANYDALTGLANRHLLMELLARQTQRFERYGDPFHLLFMDLDNFKSINDTLGHKAGDALLREVADRLAGCVRGSDTVARLGGDEFVVLLLEMNNAEYAAGVAQKILNTVRAPIQLESANYRVSASIGIAACPADASRPEDLLKAADTAMYNAKQSGRNGFQFFKPEMQKRVERDLRIAQHLMDACARGEMQLWYQPILRLEDASPVFAEALIRWNHADIGLLGPRDFIPVAEHSRQITGLGAWVAETAGNQAMEWRERFGPDFRVTVNVSPVQLEDPGFFASLRNAIKDIGLSHMVFEITETALIKNPAEARKKLDELVNAGAELAIDDFGTGYSSLQYLADFPIHYIKIAMNFIRDLGREGRKGEAVVDAVISMAHSIGARVIAEGVESGGQRDYLSSKGCNLAQGYLFGRPMPAADFADWRSRN